MVGMIKAALFALVMVGCSSSVTSVTADDGGPQPRPTFEAGPPECDGAKYAELCAGYHAGYVYGVPATCTSSPWRTSSDGVQFRKDDPDAGQDGCGTFSQSGVTCCSE